MLIDRYLASTNYHALILRIIIVKVQQIALLINVNIISNHPHN